MAKPKYWDVYRAVRDSKKTFSSADVQDALINSALSNLNRWLFDGKYIGVSLDAWKLILGYNQLDRLKWKAQSFDCDNFAICLAGDVARRWKFNGCGIVVDFSIAHAYNAIIINENDKPVVKMLEPQNDEIVSQGDGYTAARGAVFFP